MARKIEVAIVGDASSLERAFKSAGSASRGFGHVLGSAVKIGGLAAAAGVGVAAIGVKKFADAAMDAQRVQAQTQSQLKALGISYADHAGQIDKAITATSQLSGIDDEELQGSFNNLVRVTGNVSTALRDTTLAADIARGKHIELGAAAAIVTKAQMGMVTGLKRMGIEIKPVTAAVDALKESKKKYTKAEMDAAKAADLTATKQEGIAELQKKFAGAAKAYGDTAQGAQDRFRVAVENLEESLGAGLLPVFTRVTKAAAVFTEKLIGQLGEAHGFKAKLNVVWTGLQDAAQRLADAISGALQKVNWSATGAAIVDGIQQGLAKAKEIAGKLNAILSETMDSVNWEQVGTKVGPAIAAGLVAGLATLLSPGFWLRHWQELAAIALAVVPIGRFGELGVKMITPIIRPFADLLGPLLGRAVTKAGDLVLSIAGKLPSRLGNLFLSAVLLAGRMFTRILAELGGVAGKIPGYVAGKLGAFKTFVLKALAFDAIIHAAVAGATAVGNKIVHGISRGLALLGDTFVSMANHISGYIGEVASQALEWAKSIGWAIIKGVAIGIATAPIKLGEAIASKVGGAITWAYHHTGSTTDEHSAKVIGVPLGQGIIRGFLDGTVDLPEKISKRLADSLEKAKTVVDQKKEVLRAAFDRLSEYAFRAFDANTQAGLDRIAARFDAVRTRLQAKFDAQMKRIQTAYDAAVAKLDAQAAAPTEAESQLASEQAARDQAQRNADLAKANADIGAATTPEELAAAQKERDDAVWAQRQFDLEQQAAKERALRDARLDEERKALDTHKADLEAKATAANAKENNGINARQTQAEKDFQSQRDLQRQHLETQLADLEAALEKGKVTWRRAQERVLNMFADEFGPGMKTAGHNVGSAFAQGIRESQEEVAAAAHGLAQAVDDALHVRSPTKTGPMSTLDTWWSELGPTLVSGMDVRGINQALVKATTPDFAGLRSGSLAGVSAGGSASGIRGASTSGDTYHFSFPNYVGDKRDLVDTVRTEFARINKTNGGVPGKVF